MNRPLRIVTAAVEADRLRRWVEEHHAARAARDERFVKAGTRIVTRLPDGDAWVAVKQYRTWAWGQRLRNAWRGSHAARAAALGERLARRGYRLPELLGVADEPGFPSGRNSYRINRWLAGGHNLRQWLGGRPGAPRVLTSAEEVRRLARAYAAFLGRLHADRLWMPDFRPANILFEDPAAPEPALIDHDTIREEVRDWRRRLFNLAQLRLELEPVVSAALLAAAAEAYLERLPPAERPPEALLHRFLALPPPKPVRPHSDRFWREHRREL